MIAVTRKTSSGGESAQTTVGLQRFRASLANRENASCRIFVLGDSITEGEGVTTEAKRFTNRLKHLMNSRFPTVGITPNANPDYLPAFYNGSGIPDAFTLNNGATNGTFGIGARQYILSSAGHYLETTATVTAFDVLYYGQPTRGIFEVFIDGASQGTVNCGATGTATDAVKARFTSDGSSHTIRIAYSSGASSFIGGILVHNGDETKGVKVIDASKAGIKAEDVYNLFVSGSHTELKNQIDSIAPSLVIIPLGYNDMSAGTTPAQFAVYIKALIAAINTASTVPSVLLVGVQTSPTTFTYPWASYVSQLRSIPASYTNVAFMDFSASSNRITPYTGDPTGSWADTIHLSATGQSLLAANIAGFLAQK